MDIFEDYMRIALTLMLMLSFGILSIAKAQDTLPKFNIEEVNAKKILIYWINPHKEKCIQLSVQRSFDSLTDYTTIYSAQSPGLFQNGVVDKKMPKGVKIFYRVFYVLDDGNYFFSPVSGVDSNIAKPKAEDLEIFLNQGQTKTAADSAKSPKSNPAESAAANKKQNVEPEDEPATKHKKTTFKFKIDEEKWVAIFYNSRDTLFDLLPLREYKKFKDSITWKTKDTIYSLGNDEVLIKRYVPKATWHASATIFSTHRNEVCVHLPWIKQHRYRIVFYNELGDELFQLRNFKDPDFTLDNSNFQSSGWYFFDLYEDDRLKEQNKFYLPPPF